MIPEVANVQVESSVQGEKIKMRLDESATAHLMSMFTDLYEDPEKAIVREYACNGRDAQIEAGYDGPIEVTTPSPLAPFFSIRDYGTGLSIEDIREVYSAYGASTKRESNDQVGMFGIGAKCAISYTSQFTVVGVKNGRRVVVQVGRDEDGSGTMIVLEDEPTTDPTGVEITVPAKRHNTFERKVAEFFQFWPEGSVTVNGSAPKRIDGLWLADDLLITDSLGGQDYAVMGGVPYPVRFAAGQRSGSSIVAFVPVGSATPPPARESLRDTKSKEAMIESVRDRVRELSVAAVRKVIEAAPSKPEAIRVREQQRPSIGTMGNGVQWKYKGEDFPTAYEQPVQNSNGFVKWMVMTKPDLTSYGVVSEHMKERRVDPSYWVDAVWVEGYDAKFTANHKRKLVKWHEDEQPGLTISRFILCDKAPRTDWIERGRVIAWEDVRKIKLPRLTGGSVSGMDGRIPGSYDVIIGGAEKTGVPADDIDQSEPVYLYDGRLQDAWTLARVIAQVEPDATIVPLPQTRRAKFLRYFPEALNPREVVQGWVKAWAGTLTKDDKDWIAMRRPTRYSGFEDRKPALARYDADRIEDPAFKRAVRLANQSRPDLAAMVHRYQGFGVVQEFSFKDPSDAYPLLDSYHRNPVTREHEYIYVNAVYAAERAKAAATAAPAS